MSKSRELCDFLEDAISAMEKAERFVAEMSFEKIFVSLVEKSFGAGCSKMPGCKAPEILRSEAYLNVRRNDEG